MKMLIAHGVFTWHGAERRSDRYGTFAIDTTPYNNTITVPAMVDPTVESLEGERVQIQVEVVEARDSGHIGDLFRGIFPTTPEVGTVIDLGEGVLFIERNDWSVGGMMFGLLPDDDREVDWFDPHKLYRLHDQTVKVYMEVLG